MQRTFHVTLMHNIYYIVVCIFSTGSLNKAAMREGSRIGERVHERVVSRESKQVYDTHILN